MAKTVIKFMAFLLFVAVISFMPYPRFDGAHAQKATLERVTIQLRWFHQFQFAGYYAAIEKGFYAEEGLRVSLRQFEPGRDRLAPVLEGKAQYGVGDPALLKLRMQGKPVVLLAQIFQHSPSVLITRRESGIFSPEGLIGKKVMMPLDDIGSASIQSMIVESLGGLNRILVVPHTYNADKFVSGQVDAMTTYLSNEPYKLKAGGVAVNVIDPRSYGIDFYGDNLFTTEKETNQHPNRVEKILRATLKGWSYALEHKDEIIELIHNKYNPELELDQLQYEAKIVDQMIMPDLVPIGDISLRRYHRIAQAYQQLGISATATLPEGFIYKMSPEPTVALTSEERAWLRAHPNITLAYTGDFEPEVIVNSDGSHSGFLVDFLEELNKRLGIRIKLRIDSVPEILQMAETKAVDGILEMHPEYADKLGLLKTEGYLTAYPAVFARRNVSFEDPPDFSDKTVAIVNQIYFMEKMARQYGEEATILKVKDTLQGMKKVSEGNADFFIGVTFNSYILTKYQFFDIVAKYTFFDLPTKFGMAIRSDWPQLVSILNKGIASFSEKEINAITSKWSYLPQNTKALGFTPEERAWLEQNRVVRVRIGEYRPNYFTKDGKAFGIAIDMLHEIEQRTGIKFHFVIPSPPFAEDLKGLIEHTGPDLLPSLQSNVEREKLMLFTKPYLRSPRFIFTRDNAPFVSAIEDLYGKTVAVEKSFLVHGWLARDYPQIDLLVCDGTADALQSVVSGKAFAYIGPLRATSASINQYGYIDLKASAPSPFPDGITSMAVRNDWPELQSIINRSLDSISENDKQAIINKWSTVKVEYGIRPIDVLKWILIVAGGTLGILCFFLFWNRTLAKKVRQRTAGLENSNKKLTTEISQRSQAEQALRESRDYLKTLTNSLPDAVFSITFPERVIEWANDTFKVLGYEPDDCIGKTTEFLYPSKKEFLAIGDKIALAMAENKNVFHTEALLKNKNGDVFPADITLSFFKEKDDVASITAIVRDISDRKKSEEVLKESEEKFRSLVEQSPLSIQIFNADGHILQVNEAWKQLWGLSEALLPEILEKYNILEDEEARKLGVLPLIEKAFNGESVILPVIEYDASITMENLKIRGAGGDKPWIQMRLYPIKNSKGEVVNVIGVEEDITSRKQSEIEILEYQQRLKAMASQLTLAEEKERQAIAADLHDHVGHSLALARMQLNSITKAKSELEKNILVKDVSNILLAALRDTRNLISELSSPSMKELGLGAAVSEYLEGQIAKRHGLKTEFVDDIDDAHKKTLDENTRALLFRSVRELLVNVVKHARAKEVRVHFSEVAGVMKISIGDDGVGFVPGAEKRPKGPTGGFGLFSIQERMVNMGGSFDIQSEPGQGTRVELTVPLPGEKIEE